MTEQPATNKIRIVEKKPKKAKNVNQQKETQKAQETQSAGNKKVPQRTKNKKDMASKKTSSVQKKVSAKVTKVESNGLEVILEDGKKAFLPKENMHISKKKKLEEIFSEGYAIQAFIKVQKDDKIILTQKEQTPKQEKTSDKKAQKTAKKTSKKQKVEKKEKKAPQVAQESPVEKEEKEEQPKQKTLKDLKKLQSIGNMKISVGRGKKSNLTKLAEEKNEEPIELPKVPEGLLENIITSTKEATERFSNLTEELSERNLLQGNINNE